MYSLLWRVVRRVSSDMDMTQKKNMVIFLVDQRHLVETEVELCSSIKQKVEDVSNPSTGHNWINSNLVDDQVE